MLNESVAILDPKVIANRVYQTLNKRGSDGSPRYPEVEGVWIISAAHRMQVTPTMEGIPAIIFPSPFAKDSTANSFLSEVQHRWSAFTGLPLTMLPETAYSQIEYSSPEPAEEKITLGELWRRQYRAQPYLASLSSDDLLLYAARLSVEMSLIQGNPMAGRFSHLRCTRRFSEMIEELNERHVDLRIVRAYAQQEGMQFGEEARWDEITILAEECDLRIEL